MIKKTFQVVLLFFVVFTFQFCVDEELQNPQPDDNASRRKGKPTANAGSDIVITLPNNQAKLDGSKSKDSYGVITSYAWQQVAGPATSLLTSPTNVITNANELKEGVYTFRLKVTNNRNASDYDDVTVTINKTLTEQVTQPTTTTATPLFIGIMNTATVAKFSDWCSIEPWLTDLRKVGIPEIGTVCPSAYVTTEKVTDNGTSVLKAAIIGSDPSDAARFQTETYFPSRDMGIYHHTQRMKLSSDIEYIRQYPEAISPKSGNAWFTVFETWIGNSVVRQNLSISKDKGVGTPLKWDLMNETGNFQTIWWTSNTTYPVPLGKWFTMDVYIKTGEGTNGQLKITITVDGEAPVVLFDEKRTTIAPGQPNIYRRKTDHMKFYMGGALRDFMLKSNKKLETWWGDYIMYKD